MNIFGDNPSWQNLLKEETRAKWPKDVNLVAAENLHLFQGDPQRTIAIGDKIEGKNLVSLAKQTGISHFVQATNPRFDQSINFAANAIINGISALESPLEAFLRGNVSQTRISFSHSKDKTRTLDMVREYLTQVPRSRAIEDSVISIADELYTNAIFNAPIDENGRHKFAKLRRSLPIELDPHASADIFLGHDDSSFIIACRDSYGSIDLNYILERLADCYARGASAAMNFGEGGVGIGCYLMLEQSTSFFILKSPGRATVVGCVLPIGLPARLMATIPKNFHIMAMP